ncbi:unnamed protein product [Coffea canephora]|uniref:Uncharacterized protein n=1 Tax=Coffea canephora TaxID=49390 RepID=A0A068TV58_COFCA|nr:unnamed protein product [Coffea canephora]
MELQRVLHMSGGEGDTSYAKNSSYQVKPVLEQCIQELLRTNLPYDEKCIRVADLGCSSGPNTLLTVSDIIQSIDKVSQEMDNEFALPTIQVFLNDLFENDFNTVIKSLPSFYRKLEKENGRKIGSCLIAAMPGSFYGRLFPEQSVHFLHSSYSLHWLSQVPNGLVTESGISANKGSIYSSKASPPAIQKAYLDQFTKDFTTFLRMHSEELVSHGRILLTFMCKGDEFDGPNILDLLEVAINDLVVEGSLEEEKLDSFNVPIYAPSVEEVRHIIEEERSFEIVYLETFKLRHDAGFSIDDNQAAHVASFVRAAWEPILASHFGEAIIADLFHRFAKNAATPLRMGKGFFNNLIISLAKKPHKSETCKYLFLDM